MAFLGGEMDGKRFVALPRADKRWTVFDIRLARYMLPARFDPIGLEKPDALEWARLLNEALDPGGDEGVRLTEYSRKFDS